MEEEAIKKIDREYLENALSLKYKRMVIERESLNGASKFYLKVQNDNNDYAYEKFDELIELENGNYLGKKDNTYVFFDSEGTELNRISGVRIDKFQNGYAKISNVGSSFCGYIGMDGKMICDIKWGSGSQNFECGRAMVEDLGSYGYINEEGNLVIPICSIRCYSFSDDVCCIEKGGSNFYYDKDGNKLFSDSSTWPFFHEGLVKYSDCKKFGFKNKKGEIVIRPKFDSVRDFNNGIAETSNGYINLRGDSVRVSSLDDGVLYIKGFIKPSYYNSVKKVYEKMECIPYRDLGDYLLGVKYGQLVLYCKESGVYSFTGLEYKAGNVTTFRKGNLLEINNNVFYLEPMGCVDLANSFNLRNVSSYQEGEVMSYESFSINMKNDKYFFDKTVGYNKEVMIKKVQDEVNATRMLEDKKRQEIIDKLAALKKELYRLDTGAKNLSLIDEEILFSQVDDHLEINPEFISQLKYLDLALINFAGVKVSGLDFSGSNASIDPQLVYKKDMSYGKYDGLNFISSDFSGVNISGASFEGCNMDFAMMDGAINDTGYGK